MILETALMCMAINMYHEAKNQSMLGQIAVGQVVMNRVEDSRFPDNVCDVVTQSVTYKGTDKPVLHKCQFSWYCDGQKMSLTLIVKSGGMQKSTHLSYCQAQ